MLQTRLQKCRFFPRIITILTDYKDTKASIFRSEFIGITVAHAALMVDDVGDRVSRDRDFFGEKLTSDLV